MFIEQETHLVGTRSGNYAGVLIYARTFRGTKRLCMGDFLFNVLVVTKSRVA